jgi:HlyD family secretion protein
MQDRVNDKTSMPKLSRAWIAWIGAALLIVAGGTVYMTRQAQQSQQAQQAASTPLEIKTVTALGRLEPQGDIIKLGAATSSQENRISQLLVKEGDRVNTGQVIAILASRDRLQATRKQLDRDVQVAQTKLAQVQAGAKQGEKGAQQAEIDRFKQQLREEAATNRATLTRLKEQLIFEPQAQGAKIQSLVAQLAGEKPTYRSRVSRLTAQLRNATVECQRYNTLFNQQIIEASRRDSKCLEPETLQQQIGEAKAQYQQSIINVSSG